MRLKNETFELDLIARALQTISKEISYGGLAKALLEAALRRSGADRGAVLLSEGANSFLKSIRAFREKRRSSLSQARQSTNSDFPQSSAKGCSRAKKPSSAGKAGRPST